MPHRSISSLSNRGIALTVLSKLIYAVADRTIDSDELRTIHKEILTRTLVSKEPAPGVREKTEGKRGRPARGRKDTFNLDDIPWHRILDSISATDTRMKRYLDSGRFSEQEIRYMTAMLCGLSGKEYGLVTGSRSHYNLSWSIRKKLGLPSKTSNLRLHLAGVRR